MWHKKLLLFYATFVACSIFTFMILRWLSYRTPKEERSVTEISLDIADPRLKDLKNIDKEMEYFLKEETIITMRAGTFPFVDKETLVIKTRMSRPSWKGL